MKARGLGRVFQRGPIWWISYYVRGREVRESTRSTKERKAGQLLRKRLGQLESRQWVGPREERLTFRELAEDLLAHYARKGLRSSAAARSRTGALRQFFGQDRAVDVTPARLITYQDLRRQQGAAPASINRELALLRRMFTLARTAGRLSFGPAWPERLAEAAPRQGFLEDPPYLALRAAFGDTESDWRDVLDFGYYAGWRRREIQTLAWPMVDLAANVLRLTPEFSKTKDGRVLPLPPPLRAVLERRLAARTPGCPLVFHHRGRPLGDWRRRWARACKAAGLPALRFHDLRRTAARNLRRAGVDRDVAMRWLGHKTDAIYTRYNIVSEADLREAGARLAAYFGVLRAAPAPRARDRAAGRAPHREPAARGVVVPFRRGAQAGHGQNTDSRQGRPAGRRG